MNWNNLPGAAGTLDKVKDHSGSATALSATWQAPAAANSTLGREWGFSAGNLKLQKGLIRDAGSLTVSGVPYDKYAVHVYFNAGDNGGKGSVTISTATGGTDANTTYFTKVGWMSGKFVKSPATTKQSAKDSNCAVFTGNTAKDFTLNWSGKVEGSWTGVSGVQIVATP